MSNAKQRTPSMWKISDLKDNPRQAAMFGDVAEVELDALTADLRKQGLLVPIEVLPDGTIITGHQRVRAAKKLGWKQIDAVVRDDLATAGDDAVEARFVEDNFNRRQLSPLARARCIQRLMELEQGVAQGGLDWVKKEDLKQRIATRMGLSPRSVDRYLLVLKAPTSVQMAFDRGDLKLTDAGKIALLDKSVQTKLVRRLEAGEKAIALVKEYTTCNPSEPSDPSKALVRLLSALERDIPLLRGNADQLRIGRLRKNEPRMREAVDVLTALCTAVKNNPA